MIVGILIAIFYTLGSVVDLYMQTVMYSTYPNGIDLTSSWFFGLDILDCGSTPFFILLIHLI
jgi:hypothetical protein